MKTPAIRPAAALKTLTALTLIAALAALILYAALPAGASSHWIDYDTDDDGLIDITTIAQLHALRYDHDGNGWIAHAYRTSTPINYLAAYDLAFPTRLRAAIDTETSTSPRMGCAETTTNACIGYELMADLDFSTTATTSLQTWIPTLDY